MGADLRWERLNVVQPPSPTGSFTFSNLFTRPARRRRTPARRSRASCSARCSSSRSICSRTRSATARTSRSTSSRTTGACRIALTVNAGVRYTLNFPSTEENDQVGGLQPRDRSSSNISAATASRARRAQLHKINFGPRLGIVGRVTDKTVVARRLRDGLDRDGRHHDAVHDAGVSVPADRVAADARQHHAGVRAGERAHGRRRFR